ncbi:MAG: hypothetical protein UZ21_OP11001000429 [Microgenomates bacterium OLB22]|nr:MAG: hypothetical protein UZ21_OP11001000429 [Microgenomates bacterium OLB22]
MSDRLYDSAISHERLYTIGYPVYIMLFKMFRHAMLFVL